MVQLLNCLLTERKVLIISADPRSHAILIESLLDLISPVFNKSVFLNISFLKQEMIDYIDSPVPFVIGIEEQIWNRIFMRKWPELADDTIYFAVET